MNAMEQFRSEPKVKELFVAKNFVRFVKKNRDTVDHRQLLKDHLKPIIIPPGFLLNFDDLWETTMSELSNWSL